MPRVDSSGATITRRRTLRRQPRRRSSIRADTRTTGISARPTGCTAVANPARMPAGQPALAFQRVQARGGEREQQALGVDHREHDRAREEDEQHRGPPRDLAVPPALGEPEHVDAGHRAPDRRDRHARRRSPPRSGRARTASERSVPAARCRPGTGGRIPAWSGPARDGRDTRGWPPRGTRARPSWTARAGSRDGRGSSAGRPRAGAAQRVAK